MKYCMINATTVYNKTCYIFKHYDLNILAKTHKRKIHAKLNELITNSNAHERIWMLEKTLPSEVANLNALHAYSNLNDVIAKSLDRSTNLNDLKMNSNDEFHGTECFSRIWMTNLSNWMNKLRNWPGKPILYEWIDHNVWSITKQFQIMQPLNLCRSSLMFCNVLLNH